MSNVLAQGAAWLARQRTKFAYVWITYTRPGTDDEVDVKAGIGQALFTREDSQGGAALDIHSRDYLIAAADLCFDDSMIEPERGDRITEIDSYGRSRIYEVNSPDQASPPWAWHDQSHTTLRVHTKSVDHVDPELP